MSETTEEQPGTPPEPSAPEPQPTPPEPPPAREAGEAEDPVERRIARLTARLSSAARERDEFAARLAALEQYQRTQAPQQPVDAQFEQAVEARAQQKSQADRMQEKVRSFHETGAAEYPDWRQRCNDLQAMGADAQIAELLVEMPGGPKIAASLANDPEAVERIASLRGERARAIALGQYAEKLAAQPTRNVSRAPAPPRPVQGRVTPEFNIYNPSNTADQMVDFFLKQDMDRRRRA